MQISIFYLAKTIQFYIDLYLQRWYNTKGVIEIVTENFIITEFNSIFTTTNTGGKTIELKNRYCSCFIVTFSGSIKFSYKDGSVVADSEHPVFIPEGLTYQNECLEDAESLVFNFHTLNKYAMPAVLSPISHRFATEKYREIEKTLFLSTAENKMTVLSELYSLASRLFAVNEKPSHSNAVIKKATEYIFSNYDDCQLTVSQVARECFVSEVYLRKLFTEKLSTTPFKFIIKVRMKHAHDLAMERFPVKEIAHLVGYTDIYQFSRAYKKHFGYSPSETP